MRPSGISKVADQTRSAVVAEGASSTEASPGGRSANPIAIPRRKVSFLGTGNCVPLPGRKFRNNLAQFPEEGKKYLLKRQFCLCPDDNFLLVIEYPIKWTLPPAAADDAPPRTASASPVPTETARNRQKKNYHNFREENIKKSHFFV